MTTRTAIPFVLLLVWPIAASWPQTIEQSEESIAYLQKRACAGWDGSAWVFVPATPKACLSDLDCAAPTYCRHRSDVEPKADLYPKLRFPNAPTAGGPGEGTMRYVPLCEDGSGNHEYSLSGDLTGPGAPTCSPQDYIRCANGVRPFYRVDAGTGNNWLIYAGGGGHASAPSDGTGIWTLVHTQGLGGAYSATTSPTVRDDLEGVFDESASNPFSTYNRVWLDKCTPDRWLGNRSHHDLQDFVETLTLPDMTIDPPKSPNSEYSVYYHGKRIVRAVVGEVLNGFKTYSDYPSVVEDDFTEPPGASSMFLFTCHSNGCNGLQNGHIDDLHELIETHFGTDVDVRALFSSNAKPGVESAIAVSDYDCVDVDLPIGVPDNHGDIDDSLSIYDHVIDDRAITLQPMSSKAFEPGTLGRELNKLIDWWDPAVAGYDEPVDASCLDHHCPLRPLGWADQPSCAPCNESLHVLLNHLSTPFVYNQAQRDNKAGSTLSYCQTGGVPDAFAFCDVEGQFSTGVNMKDTHWRKQVRKQLADLFRLGELDRCEGGVGSEWPYDQMLLLAPNWDDHGGLDEPLVLTKQLQMPGAASPETIGELVRTWVDTASPTKAICLTEHMADENADDFDDVIKGSIAVCLDSP